MKACTGNPTCGHQIAALLATLVALVGCGESGPARRPVSGSVTLDGRPLRSGTITFAPREGTTAATAEVRDGVFRIGRAAGPAPGPYQIEVYSVEPTGKRIRHPDLPSETMEEVRNLIPPRYNARTRLVIEVKPAGENSYKFDLSRGSDAARPPRR